jgi:hypothetical protein
MASAPALAYPTVPRDEAAGDTLHGTCVDGEREWGGGGCGREAALSSRRFVADPYRALEDPDAPGTVEFVKQQNEVTAK